MAYPAPVDVLLTLGQPPFDKVWDDYIGLGIGREHIPPLIRMVADETLGRADSDSPLVCAPVHAWRALSQLGAVEALPALLDTLKKQNDPETYDDWIAEDFPQIFANLGPTILQDLIAYLYNPDNGTDARCVIPLGLSKIASNHPGERDAIIAAFVKSLVEEEPSNDAVNAAIVAALCQMHATEVAPQIEAAFADDRVDTELVGTWPWVRYDLGLGPRPGRPQERYPFGLGLFDYQPDRIRPAFASLSSTPKAQAEKRKAKRKQAKKARKRNRG
jgi:Protein of unknown function (DUF1186)